MTDLSHLIFFNKKRVDTTPSRRGFPKIITPRRHEQGFRIDRQLMQLQDAFENRRVDLQSHSAGLFPEKVLVIETFGLIDDFIHAVKQINGLEWLVDFHVDDFEPEYGFDYKDGRSLIPGRMFLVMTNQTALTQFRNLFKRWSRNANCTFPQGLSKLKRIFEHIRILRYWGVDDRVVETGILEDWELRLSTGTQNAIPFEAELWFRDDPYVRQKFANNFAEIVTNYSGEIINDCIIPEICYHGVFGNIPNNLAKDIIDKKKMELLECDSIMYLRPASQCSTLLPYELDEEASNWIPHTKSNKDTFPDSDPVVALFDGLPFDKHELLTNRLIIDDPDNFEDGYDPSQRRHGTWMASLICHGDLNENGSALRTPIYVRPILKPNFGNIDSIEEKIPDEILPIDLIHRAVKHVFTENDSNINTQGIRIINLSVCNSLHHFYNSMSSWARLLDWLSLEYNVLFIVSAGNHFRYIEIDVPVADFKQMNPTETTEIILKSITNDTRNRRLLSPAETINGITVGATHSDRSDFFENSGPLDPYVNWEDNNTNSKLFEDNYNENNGLELPSIYTAHGPGYLRSTKPEIYVAGGKLLLQIKQNDLNANTTVLKPFGSSKIGQCVATPGEEATRNSLGYVSGTSNATALVSRNAAMLYDTLNMLQDKYSIDLTAEHDIVLLKALLVHSTNLGKNFEIYSSVLKKTERGFSRDHASRFLGYGFADFNTIYFSTEQRVTILGFGSLNDKETDEFSLPLTEELRSRILEKRLTATLAWITPVNCRSQKYRMAKLEFKIKNIENLEMQSHNIDLHTAKRGTVQHEIYFGKKPPKDEYAIFNINCRSGADDILDPVHYGFVVTLEIPEEAGITIYEQIRDLLSVQVPTQTRIRND